MDAEEPQIGRRVARRIDRLAQRFDVLARLLQPLPALLQAVLEKAPHVFLVVAAEGVARIVRVR